MIQLIGFLLCVYMFVRGLDIASRAEDRKSRSSSILANLAAVIAVIGAVIFFYLFIEQGNATANLNNSPLTAPSQY